MRIKKKKNKNQAEFESVCPGNIKGVDNLCDDLKHMFFHEKTNTCLLPKMLRWKKEGIFVHKSLPKISKYFSQDRLLNVYQLSPSAGTSLRLLTYFDKLLFRGVVSIYTPTRSVWLCLTLRLPEWNKIFVNWISKKQHSFLAVLFITLFLE